jgi:hypothetical protein
LPSLFLDAFQRYRRIKKGTGISTTEVESHACLKE